MLGASRTKWTIAEEEESWAPTITEHSAEMKTEGFFTT